MRRVLLAGFLVLGAGQALASGRNPQLPSSGIVIHVFGPDAGIPEQATPTPGTPTAPAAATVPGAPAQVSDSAAPAVSGVAIAAPPSAAATPSAYPEPQLGTVLHEMFVTGDPNRGSGFSEDRKKVR